MVALFTGNDINLGLEQMLALYGLKFEGKPHSGEDDSRNIARLFLKAFPKPSFGASEIGSPFVDNSESS